MQSSLLVLLRFHWSAGARVALRSNAALLGIVVFLFGSAPDAGATFRGFVLGVVARGHPGDGLAILAAIGFAFASAAAPRVSLGAAGWMRSLPMSARTKWWAAVGALVAAQLAVVIFLPIAVLLALFVYRASLAPQKMIVLPFIVVATAALATPLRLRVSSVKRRNWTGTTLSPRSPLGLSLRMTARAIGVRGFIGGALPAGVFPSFAFFFLRNNADLAPQTAATAIRICGTLAVAAFATALAGTLQRSRQPWPWSRSLPWSCRARLLMDALAMGAPLALIPLGLVILRVAAGLAVAALIPFAAVSAAAATRVPPERQSGAAGECLVSCLAAGTLIAAWPIMSGAVLLGTFAVVRLGERRERRTIASRWSELHHAGEGDPSWMSKV